LTGNDYNANSNIGPKDHIHLFVIKFWSNGSL